MLSKFIDPFMISTSYRQSTNYKENMRSSFI